MSWSILGFIWYRFTSPDRILRVEGERDAEAAEEQEAREAAEAAERKALARINKEYGEVYDEVKGCEAAVERLHSNEPEDIMEAASVVLSSHKILWGDDGVRRGMKSETGYGEGERRKMFGMFASRENGGVSLRRLAEDPMKEVCEAHGIVYDSREAMDALLDVLQAAAVPSDIRKYIEKRRMAQALELKRQEDAYLREQYEEWCREMYHMSADEYEAYEEYMSEELKNLEENFDEKEYFDNIADEISNIEKNGYREIQKDDAEREGRGNGGSGEVLSAERAVQRGGDATDAGQPGLSERDGIQGDGAERPVLESTPGRSEVRPGFDGGVAAAEGAGGQGLRPGGSGAEQADAAAAGDGAGAVSTELDENGHPFILSKDGTTGPNGEPTVSGGKGNALPGDTQADGAESSEPYTITPTTYTNKRGKTSDVYFVKFGRELTAGEMDAAYDYIDEPLEDGKKTKRGWYDRKQGGYMMRSEESARGLGELIGGGEADSEGAVVAGVADVAEVNAAHQAVRDMLVAKGLMREGEGLDLIVNSSNDMEDGAAITGLQAKVVRKRMEQALGKDNPTYQDVHDAVTNTVSRAKVNVNGLSFLYEMLDKFNSGEVTAGEFMDVVESMFHLDKRGQAMPEHQAWVRRMAASGCGSSSGPEGADKPDKPSGSGGASVLERDDFKPAGKRRSGGKKPKGAVNRVDVEGLMEELSGTGEASLADHSEPVVTEDKPKGGFKVTDEMRKQEEELRKLLGIGDDEGDRGERFRDPDGMTPAEKRMVFRLGVDYAFNFLDNGITGFEDFAKAVTGRLGSKVKPFVKSWYEGAKRVPGYGGEGYTPSEEVDRFDIENFDRPGTDVFREAEMRAAEHKARKAAEQAEREMIEEKRKRIEGDERRAGKIGEEGFERMSREELTFWGKLKAKLQRALENLLRGLKIPKMRKWRDREWAYVLHKAYKAKKNGGKPDVFEAAEDAAMRARAGVDEPAREMTEQQKAEVRKDATADRIEELFDAAVKGDFKGNPVKVGFLTAEGKAYLEKLSGIKLKGNVRFMLNPSDLAHIYNDHFGQNEKDQGNNIPLTKGDIRNIGEILRNPDKVVFGIEKTGDKRKMFFFLKEDGNSGTFNLLEIYANSWGNLTSKSFYHTKKSVSQRVLSLKKSEHLTSVTDGPTLKDGAKLPTFFEYPKSEEEKTTRFRDSDMGLDEYVTKIKVEAAKASGDNLAARHEAMKAIGGNLNKLRQAMARQREYDVTTVRSVTDLARVFMDEGLLDDLSKVEMKRILGSVNRVVGRQDTAKEVQKVLDIMVDNQLRLSAKAFGSLLKVKGSRVNAAGVEVQGELDARGQQMVQVLKKGIRMQPDEVQAQICFLPSYV